VRNTKELEGPVAESNIGEAKARHIAYEYKMVKNDCTSNEEKNLRT